MGRYILMNKNTEMAEVQVQGDEVTVIKEFIQFPTYLKDNHKWLIGRLSMCSRANLLEIAKLLGIEDREDFVNVSKAISVTDTLWLNREDKPTTWDKVNPYKNRLSLILANLALNGGKVDNTKNIKTPSPQYLLDGSAEKCVKRINHDIYMYKTCGEKWSDLAGCRPYSEYYASSIMRKLNMSRFVDYDVIEKTTESGHIKPYSTCKIFTDENNGLIQIGDTKFSSMTTDELKNKLPKKAAIQLMNMAVIDSIILNCDRHTGNYGFIIDNNTLRIKAVAPIYDNDCSLGSLISLQYKSLEEAYEETARRQPRFGEGGYNGIARWGMTRDMLNRLKSVGYIKLERKFKGLSEKRMKFMEYIVNRRIKEILDMFE